MPPVDRGLRVRRSSDPQEHQEGRERRAGPRVHETLQEARHRRARRLHYRPAGRDTRDDQTDSQVRRRARPGDDSSFDRSFVSRNRTRRLYEEEQLLHPDRRYDRRDGPSASDHSVPGAHPRRDRAGGRAFLRPLLFSAEDHLQDRSPRGFQRARTQAAVQGSEGVSPASSQTQGVRTSPRQPMSRHGRSSSQQPSAAFAQSRGSASALLPETQNDNVTPAARPQKQLRLIINADDFGMSEEVNEAAIRAYKEGVLTSTSLMVTAAAFEQAVRLAKENPGLAVGIHLVTVVGKSVLPHREIPTLVDEKGNFSNNPAM